jgi:predicted porin
VKAQKIMKLELTGYRKHAVALAIGLMSLSRVVEADDSVKRMLDLQLKKGIITQEEYDEFMAATDEASGAAVEAGKKAEVATQTTPPASATSNAPATNVEGGIAVVKTDNLKVEVFGTLDLSVGYTSHSLVQNGEMPTSIGPWISGGVKYPRTVPVGPGGAQVPYPASNMSSQTGIFNSALSTSSWGIRATRDIGDDGLKAFALLDSAINPATGQLTDQSHNESLNSRYPTTAYATSSLNGQLFAKEAYIGLSGNNWGRVTFGRNNNPILDVMNSYSPLQKAGLFMPYGNGVYGAGGGISENGRVDNSIKYQLKSNNINYGLLYGFGGTGGLKQGARGAAANIGVETDRFGVQLVYEGFTDLLKTSTDPAVANTIDLTAYDQTALLLVAKFKLTDQLGMKIGAQQAKLTQPTFDANIPFISNLYGENVNKSSSYQGEANKINTAHLGFDYDLNEKTYTGVAYTYIGLPKYDFGTPNAAGAFPSHYLGGNIDAWSGLVIYRLYKGTDIYGGMIFTHYRGAAFEDTSTSIFANDIFTATTGFRFKF